MVSRIPPNLRINADDFGLHPGISRAIVGAAREGLVNAFSVVPFADEESAGLLSEACSIPGIRIGAHLSFVEVPLLTRPAAFPDGRPPASHREFLRLWLGRRITRQIVRDEWRAQLDRLRQRLGGAGISHLDSHQHLHALPGLWTVARELQREYRVPLLRRPAEWTLRAWRKDFPLGAGLQALAALCPGSRPESCFGIGTSMRFCADVYRFLPHAVRADPTHRYELMVHPSEDDRGQRELSELRRFVSWL